MRMLYISYDGLMDPVSQSQVLPYIKRLSGKGIQIFIISFEKKDKVKNKEVFNLCKNEVNSYSIKWVALKYHKFPVIPATIFDILQGVFFGLIMVLFKKVNIIHGRGYVAALIALILKYITGRKIIFDMRGFWPDEKVDAGAWKENGMVYSVLKKIEKQLINKSDEVVVLTEVAREVFYRAFPNSSFTVIPCGTDGSLFKSTAGEDILPDRARGKFIVIYIGSLGTFYNLEDMVGFFKIFKNNIPNSFFWIVTNSSHNIAHKLMLASHFDGSDYTVNTLSYKDIPNALACADVSIMFYRRRLSNIGCSPIKFAESLFCGVPVIINSGIGDTEETIINNKVGVIINHFNDSEYKRTSLQLLKLLDDNNLRKRCRQVAQKEFSLDKGINKYYSIYARIGMSRKVSNSCSVCKKMDYKFLFKKENLQLVKCRHCGLVRFDNIMQAFDTQNYYYYKNKIMKKQQDLYNPITTKRYNNLLNKLQSFRKNNAVFDIGCGVGQFLSVAKKMNWQAKGVEVSPYAVTICKNFNLDVTCQDFLQAKIQHDYYDIVTMFEVLEHLTQPREYLLKANKILRKGGIIVITTPNFNCLTRILLRERWRLIHKEHLFYFTPSSFKKLIHDANFRIIEFITKDITLPELYKLISSKKSYQTIDKVFTEHQCLRRIIEERKTLLFLKDLTNIFFNITKLGESMQCICQKI